MEIEANDQLRNIIAVLSICMYIHRESGRRETIRDYTWKGGIENEYGACRKRPDHLSVRETETLGGFESPTRQDGYIQEFR